MYELSIFTIFQNSTRDALHQRRSSSDNVTPVSGSGHQQMATRSASISVTSGSYSRNVEGSTLTQPTFIIDSATSNSDRGGSTKVRNELDLSYFFSM